MQLTHRRWMDYPTQGTEQHDGRTDGRTDGEGGNESQNDCILNAIGCDDISGAIGAAHA